MSRQCIADAIRAATEPSEPSVGKSAEMSSRDPDCQCRSRSRRPLPTAATMRAKKMINAMTGTELTAAAPSERERVARERQTEREAERD